MSRILVVGINYAPEFVSTGKYTSEMCEWLAAQGHDVRMVTAPPYYPAWAVWPEYRGHSFQREQRNGVDVLRGPIWVPAQPRGLTRLLHLASFALSAAVNLAASLFWRPELVINVAPTLASAPAAWIYARLTNAKCWLHMQDFELDAALNMGIVDAGPLRRLAVTAERWLLRRFDVVSSISPRMLARLADKGVAKQRIVSFPNWADIDAIAPLAGPSSYRVELSIPNDAVVALYSGNMGLKQGLELLGQAAHILADTSNVHFVFGGQGPGRAELEQQCHGLRNVHFLPLQPSERLCEWLGLADIHLLPQRADVADLVMPSKLTGMLASGRPTLATAAPDTGVALALEGRGVVTPPGDGPAFAQALRQLADNPAQRARLGAASRHFAEAMLSRQSVLNQLQHSIAIALGAGPAPLH